MLETLTGFSGVAESVLDLIGHTPVLQLNRIQTKLGLRGRLLAKLEHLNPGGSKKDRVALFMIRAARDEGKLVAGQPVVEVTSGNTGTGLAVVCRAMGHPFYAVMSRGNTRERAQMMRALGAEVVLVDQNALSVPGKVSVADMDLVRGRAAELVKTIGAFYCDQHENPANAAAHEFGTALELWEQCGGEIDAVVAFVGSGGALGGLAKGLRKVQPKLKAYFVEPVKLPHVIQGGGYGRERVTHLAGVAIDGRLRCSDEQAAQGARMLANEEGILAGYSTGAQLHAAIQLMGGAMAGKSVAFLVCDSGMKYLSTDLYP